MEVRSEMSRAPISPEVKPASVKDVVGKVESVLQKDGGRVPGGRFGLCGYASNLVRYFAEHEGLHADIFQVNDIHRAFGGQKHDAFRHTFNVVQDPNGYVLVDETFGQFVHPDTSMIGQGIGSVSGPVSEHPIHRVLLEEGFVPLNDESLREYLRATTSSQDRSYIDQVTVEDVLSDVTLPLDWDYTVEELESYISGSASKERRTQGKFKSLMNRVQERFLLARL